MYGSGLELITKAHVTRSPRTLVELLAKVLE